MHCTTQWPNNDIRKIVQFRKDTLLSSKVKKNIFEISIQTKCVAPKRRELREGNFFQKDFEVNHALPLIRT